MNASINDLLEVYIARRAEELTPRKSALISYRTIYDIYVGYLEGATDQKNIILGLVEALEDTVDCGYDQAGYCEQALETLRKRLEGK